MSDSGIRINVLKRYDLSVNANVKVLRSTKKPELRFKFWRPLLWV